MSIKSLEMLEAWKKAKEFALRIYREVLHLLPPEEKWNPNQQLRRSSNSVPANIAEGYGRFYYHVLPLLSGASMERMSPVPVRPSTQIRFPAVWMIRQTLQMQNSDSRLPDNDSP